MNRLSREQRKRILHLLVEGVSMRSITRMVESVTKTGRRIGTSINTVTKLPEDAGDDAGAYHHEHVRNVRAEYVEMDEIWSFIYAKHKNVELARKAPEGVGDAWTWTAFDADTKLIISWCVGKRDTRTGKAFIRDLGSRLAYRAQLMADGLWVCPEAVEAVFGSQVDFAQLVKLYASNPEGERRYSTSESTSYVERQNLNMRMGVRRFTRLTNAFSKKLANHVYHVALYTLYHNFCRIHTSLRMTPAMAVGLTDTLYDVDWIVEQSRSRPGRDRRGRAGSTSPTSGRTAESAKREE